MTAIIALTLLISAGSLLDVETIPLDHNNAVCFLARTQVDRSADLFVLSGNQLNIYKRH